MDTLTNFRVFPPVAELKSLPAAAARTDASLAMASEGTTPLTRLLPVLALGLLALVAPASAAEAALGPDAGACRTGAGQSAILVNVSGFKARTGGVRVQIYGANPAEFLEKGKKLRRIDVPISGAATMPVCIQVPGPGQYAVAVRHDVNGNNRSDWSDGGGFSRNPRLSLSKPKPRFGDVVISVANGVTPTQVMLNYKKGLSIGPVSS